MIFGFPLRKKALFFRQLSTMVTAAMGLNRAVSTAGTGVLPQAEAMSQAISNGNSLSQTMAQQGHLFSDYEVQIVRVGETSGTLDRQLCILAEEMERTYQLRSSLMSKLAYPVFVAHMAVFIPPIVLLVQSGPAAYFGMTLGTLIPIYLIGGGVAAAYHYSSAVGGMRSLVDNLLSWVPVLGGVLRLLALTRFLRALAHVTEAGMLPFRAFELAAQTCGNTVVANRAVDSYKKLGQDRKLSEWMQHTGLFPPATLGLVTSGEETGNLGGMLAKAAELLEQDYRSRLQMVVTVLPVLMLIAVGILVGFRVVMMMRGYLQLLEL